MKNTLVAIILAIGLFSSCQKKDPTQTRVGFYVLNADGKHLDDGMEYKLFIDNVYKGTLEVSQFETTDMNLLNYQTLDANKHHIEVKLGDTRVSSTYLRITSRQASTGTECSVGEYVNGGSFKRLDQDRNPTYAIFQ